MNILSVKIKNIKSAIRMNRRYIPVFLLHKGEQQLASDLSQISRQYKVEILGAHSGVVKKFANGPCCRRGKYQENTIIFSGIYAGFGTSKTGAAMGGLMLNIDRLDYTALSYLSLKFLTSLGLPKNLLYASVNDTYFGCDLTKLIFTQRKLYYVVNIATCE